MLVLSRSRHEEIVFTDSVTGKLLGVVSVVGIRGDKVRLGFDFPKNVNVHRREVQDAIEAKAEELRQVAEQTSL